MPDVVQNSSRLSSLLSACVLLLAGLSGCHKTESEGEAPPLPKPRQLDRCQGVADGVVDGLPAKVAGFCLDPNVDVKRYGEGTASPLDVVCTELFNGECELYKRYGLEGVKTFTYGSTNSSVTITAVVSSFRMSSGAFGFFTRRIIGDGLPSQVTVTALAVSGRAALGPGVAYLWKGKHVVEMNYVSEVETPVEVTANSKLVLSELARITAQSLPGPEQPPAGVLLLEAMIPRDFVVLGHPDGLLGLSGTGPYVVGFHEGSSDVPAHRLVVAERHDEASASDLVKTILASFPSKKQKWSDSYQVRWSKDQEPPKTLLLTRDKERVLIVEPIIVDHEPTVSDPTSRKEDEARWQQFARDRLGELKRASARR